MALQQLLSATRHRGKIVPSTNRASLHPPTAPPPVFSSDQIRNSRKKRKMAKIGQMTGLINDEDRKRIRAFIPEEMATEIFLRLPVKSVVRLRCVSKLWNSIISFITTRAHQSIMFVHQNTVDPPFRTRLYLPSADTNNDVGFTLRELPHVKMLDKTRFIKSCDGLLLFSSSYPDREFIINPLTGRYCFLPRFIDHINNLLGFYFHSPTSKYRLLGIYGNKTQVLVVGENKWRRIHDQILGFLRSSDSVDVNKSLYWLTWKRRKHIGLAAKVPPPHTVLAFDKETEAFSLFPLPPYEELYNRVGNLMNFNGELGLWVISEYGIIDLWILKERWIKRCSVYHPYLKGFSRNFDYFMGEWQLDGAFSIKDEELLIAIKARNGVQHLIQWELISGACFIQHIKKNHSVDEQIFQYSETLFSADYP